MTATAAINLNTQRDALQRDIVETADRAAEMVEHAMNLTGRQRHGRQGFTVHQRQVVARSVAVVSENLDVLLAQPAQPMLVWGRVPDGDEGWHPQHGQPRHLVDRDGIDIALQLIELSRNVYQALGLPVSDTTPPCPAPRSNGTASSAAHTPSAAGTAPANTTAPPAAGHTGNGIPWLQRGVIDLMRELEEREKNMQLLTNSNTY